MSILVGALVVALVLAVAALVLLREQARVRAGPPRPVFDLDDAVAWVARHLPAGPGDGLVAADVRRIVSLQLEYMSRKGAATNGSTPKTHGPVVVGGSETVHFVLEATRAAGQDYTPEQVYAVVETQLAYLRAIGAIGERAEPGEVRRRDQPPPAG
jgi:hypothetical protein